MKPRHFLTLLDLTAAELKRLRANLEDLQSQTTEGAQQLQARIMESTVGFLHRPL